MEKSILDTIKAMLGLADTYEAFDNELVSHINSALFIVGQLGIGPSEGFRITDSHEEWSNLLGPVKDLESVKTFVYLKVRETFDPPMNSFILTALQNQAQELAWRINAQVDNLPPAIAINEE